MRSLLMELMKMVSAADLVIPVSGLWISCPRIWGTGKCRICTAWVRGRLTYGRVRNTWVITWLAYQASWIRRLSRITWLCWISRLCWIYATRLPGSRISWGWVHLGVCVDGRCLVGGWCIGQWLEYRLIVLRIWLRWDTRSGGRVAWKHPSRLGDAEPHRPRWGGHHHRIVEWWLSRVAIRVRRWGRGCWIRWILHVRKLNKMSPCFF